MNLGSYKGRANMSFRSESKNKPMKMGREALKGEDGWSMLRLTIHRGKTSGARQGMTERVTIGPTNHDSIVRVSCHKKSHCRNLEHER